MKRRRPYELLCVTARRLGGRIRLDRIGDRSMGLTVTFADEGETTRAIGFVTPLDELETVAGLALWWLTVVGAGEAAVVPPQLPTKEER